MKNWGSKWIYPFHQNALRALWIVLSNGAANPERFVVDNEPKNISGLLHCWTEKRGTQLDYIQPRKPQQNAYMECHNRTTWHEWFEMKELANIEEIYLTMIQ